jgi:hypothetical protein
MNKAVWCHYRERLNNRARLYTVTLQLLPITWMTLAAPGKAMGGGRPRRGHAVMPSREK